MLLCVWYRGLWLERNFCWFVGVWEKMWLYGGYMFVVWCGDNEEEFIIVLIEWLFILFGVLLLLFLVCLDW